MSKLTYIGTNIIRAEPKTRAIPCTLGSIAHGDDIQQGYELEYEDGHISWSPKEVFESAYRCLDDRRGGALTFSDALFLLRTGHKVIREVWQYRGYFYVVREHEKLFVYEDGRRQLWWPSHVEIFATDWKVLE